MFAAYVFTIIDSQDMQERNRLGPVAVTPGGAHRFGLIDGVRAVHSAPYRQASGATLSGRPRSTVGRGRH